LDLRAHYAWADYFPRIECSKSTVKDGAEPVLVNLHNNLVLTVNKQKTFALLQAN
jgi:hypothetical protein